LTASLFLPSRCDLGQFSARVAGVSSAVDRRGDVTLVLRKRGETYYLTDLK
jgi:hypothetical protein